MAREPLHPDVLLGIHISSVMSRNQWTKDPDAVIAELRETAGDRTDILAQEVGTHVGFYERDKYQQRLITALRVGFPDLDLEPWIEIGRRRAAIPDNTTRGFERKPAPDAG